ncbi:vicilin-like seed storage protein At2g18540 [Nicotiana sylvestris]|uniref:Eukaryotic translation initiation factor 3 subunit A n=1 Tax=Nicotiana sylvestris TaxID=4096 RepID=A0A1U7YMQ6_NICSY|nr:PREDICTED: eukaryotic translation initiation factor 3 subunit A [Nicotiana sylvestris]XP_016444380.1 PREDICTED: vicilin-like seed storage protein At2g18540 [Nicotiana tabacum]
MSDQKSVSTPFQCCRILFKFLLFMVIISNVAISVTALTEQEGTPGREWGLGPLVKRGERKSVVSTENGEVSSVRVADGITGSYHLQFITLEPNSLFLPVVLHADMVFYVHTGSGRLTWMDETEQKSVDLRIGDVFRLPYGTIFFIESNLEPARQKLRVYSIFANSGDDLREPLSGPYSNIRDMILGFDRKVLQAAFHVPEDVIDEVLNGTEVPAIIHGVPKTTKKTLWEMEAEFMKSLLGRGGHSFFDSQSNKKKTELFNIFKEKPDFENCNGWSTVITRKKLPALKGSHIGIYVVNLTKGSMMGPHWNPTATEIGIALQGEGMVRVVCSSTGTEQGCKNMRFKVEEGDVFAVPRFHPMAQMAFNNNSFVFVGFSTTTKRHHPQYLTGKASVLRTLDRQILAASFNVTNTTMDRILEAQGESVILECTSCAEEEVRLMEEERRRAEEEARRREEEEARQREEERRREEEEARRKEEEEARKAEEERREREAEEARRREEEAAKEKEEQRRRQEEEARRKEEEEARRQEEEIRRRQEEEEARKREEEEAAKRQQEESAEREAEAARRREEEEAARRQQEEEAQKEAEEARRREEEAERRREEQAQREAEEARRREEEAAARRRQEQEEAERERQAEEARREEKETRRHEEEEEEEEARRGERGEEEEEEGRREEEEAREAERRRQEEAERQEEAARRQEEEMERRHQEEEETEEEEQGPYTRRRKRTFLKTA